MCTTGLEVAAVAAKFKLAKCVTLQTQDVGVQGQPKPIEKWVWYTQYVAPGQTQCLDISKKSDWKLADEGQVLLHINIPNQQVYPLPLLITPIHCIYFVAFNLPEGKEDEMKVLKRIHDTLKDVYTYSSCKEPGLDDSMHVRPKVFLVGLQKEEKDRSSFTQRLRQHLKARSYERLLVFPASGDPYWTNLGTELHIHDNAALLNKIQHQCCPPPQLVHQSLVHQCELLQRFRDNPFVLYKDVEGAVGKSNLEQFLKILHCYGIIFYPKSEDVMVVLQPQYLYHLFEEVRIRSKNMQRVTTEDLFHSLPKHIADLFTSAATPTQHDVQEWFQRVCTNMGLVIVRYVNDVKPDYVFVNSLSPDCSPPDSTLYSVDPLLVSYGLQEDNDCLLPSCLFPAFVTAFLKELKVYVNKQRKSGDNLPKARLRVRDMAQQYLHVSIHGSKHIHVAERDSFIEIGLQQFHISTRTVTEDDQLMKLREFCKDIYGVVSESAEYAAKCLDSSSIRYGFYLQHHESHPVNRFGEFDPTDGSLSCCCCPAPEQSTLQQKIWFLDIEHSLVCLV